MVISHIVSLLIVFALAGMFVKCIPFCQSIVSGLGTREPQIDGLRGLCAIMVVLHHLVFFFYYKTDGKRTIPTVDNFATTRGNWGRLIFLIYAYLFWGALLDQPIFTHSIGNHLRKNVCAA